MSSTVEENHVRIHVQQPPCDTPPNLPAADANRISYAVCAILTFLRMVHSTPRPGDERYVEIACVSNLGSGTTGNIGLQNVS